MPDSKFPHSNLVARLFQVAIPHIECYHSDLAHDALMIAKADKGDVFLWSYRTSGTALIKMMPDNQATEEALVTGSGAGSKWFWLDIVEPSKVFPEGFIHTVGDMSSALEFIAEWHKKRREEG